MVTSIAIILAGVLLIIFRKALLRSRGRWEKENFGIKLGPKDIRFGEILAMTIGIATIIFGLLGVLGVVK